jgi:uncharacterized protein (DUF885 family)
MTIPSSTFTHRRLRICKVLAGLVAGAALLSAPALAQSESGDDPSRVNRLFDQAFDELSERRPTELSRLGLKKLNDRWDDLSPSEARARYQVMSRWASLAKNSGAQGLDDETALSLKLFLSQAEQEKAALEFLDYDYPVNQMFGLQAEVPAFLINVHQVSSLADAESYILRLQRLPALFEDLAEGMLRREKMGIMPPRFVFDYVLSDIDNLLTGYPLQAEGADPAVPHPVWSDFQSKVKDLRLEAELESDLLARGQAAMREGFAPAYQRLREVAAAQASRATTDDGCWKFPRGADYYAFELHRVTTTKLSAEEIHQLGLSEVARIHSEMEEILKKVGFQGTLQEFFKVMRTDPRFLYANDDAGKEAYLKEATAIIDRMRLSLDDFFLTKPKAALVVKRVEPYREKSAGKAFYESPALDGSRPGIYYANLYDMASMPIYQMEALAYHEGIPGHHMQLSIAQELEGLPKFRRLGGYTAYIEGWGLYCEQLPKEHGFYQDPYSDFGRLAMELFRAARLVVDTGIHHKRWTRQQGLDYYLATTPNAEGDCQKMVDRHIVMPGQATAYKVGMIEILRLREKAKTRLGAAFDLREFHDTVLVHGAVPLQTLEELVDGYIESKLARAN